MIDAPVARPIGRRTRETAAVLCAIRADGCSWGDLASLGLTWGDQAHRLADAAINAAWRTRAYHEACAEAEAMLRTGWEP